nr:MAG TPA: hypothetical protein [Caudoviricetes sp.]
MLNFKNHPSLKSLYLNIILVFSLYTIDNRHSV